MAEAVFKENERELARKREMALVQQAANGDAGALRVLADQIFDPVRRTVSYLCGAKEDTEDIAQIAMIAILRSIGSFRGECSLQYWADRVAVNTAAKYVEKKQRRRTIIEHSYLPPVKQMVAEEQVELRRARQRLTEHLFALPIKERVVLVLHYVNGYEIVEVAQMTHCKVNTIRGRLRTGRKKLRKKILNDSLLNAWREERSQ